MQTVRLEATLDLKPVALAAPLTRQIKKRQLGLFSGSWRWKGAALHLPDAVGGIRLDDGAVKCIDFEE
ncbi:MAG: hypothetical protein ACREU6_09810 [Steroidobacteraceae bacterium]